MMQAPPKFLRILEARCPGCGPKESLLYRGRRYELPIIVDMARAEHTPWRCGDCRQRITLEAEEVE